VFYVNLNCSKTNGRNSRTHVVPCSLTDQGLTWLFAIGCETIRLKYATLLAKLPINVNYRAEVQTEWNGRAQHSCKGVQIQRIICIVEVSLALLTIGFGYYCNRHYCNTYYCNYHWLWLLLQLLTIGYYCNREIPSYIGIVDVSLAL